MKNTFISAYCYCYGATKKEAAAVYENATPDYIQAVINSFYRDVYAAFYND